MSVTIFKDFYKDPPAAFGGGVIQVLIMWPIVVDGVERFREQFARAIYHGGKWVFNFSFPEFEPVGEQPGPDCKIYWAPIHY